MKRFFRITFLVALLCAGFAARAQERRNNVKVNILSPIARTISVFYERSLDERNSLQLGVFHTRYQGDGFFFTALGFTPEYHLHLFKNKQPSGWYLGPFLRYVWLHNDDQNSPDPIYDKSFRSYGGGFILGKQWMFDNGINLNLFFGPSYLQLDIGNEEYEEGDEVVSTFNSFTLRLGFTVGYAF